MKRKLFVMAAFMIASLYAAAQVDIQVQYDFGKDRK